MASQRQQAQAAEAARRQAALGGSNRDVMAGQRLSNTQQLEERVNAGPMTDQQSAAMTEQANMAGLAESVEIMTGGGATMERDMAESRRVAAETQRLPAHMRAGVAQGVRPLLVSEKTQQAERERIETQQQKIEEERNAENERAFNLDHKMFRSITGEPIRIALTTGHVTWVQTSATPLHRRFWSHAYALGCEAEDGAEAVDVSEMTLDQRKEKVVFAMRKYHDDDADAPPDSGELSKKLGFAVTDGERDVLWQELKDNPELGKNRVGGETDDSDID